jgi:glutamate dehydrogenase
LVQEIEMEEVVRGSRARALELLGSLAGELPMELERLFDHVVGGMSSEEISSAPPQLIARATYELAAAVSHYDLGSKIGLQLGRVRPSAEQRGDYQLETVGLESSTCFVAIVTPDMKYLVDTFTEVMAEFGVSPSFSIHPMIDSESLEKVRESDPRCEEVSLFYAEFEQEVSDGELDALAASLSLAYEALAALHKDLPLIYEELEKSCSALLGTHDSSETALERMGLGNLLPVTASIGTKEELRWLGCEITEVRKGQFDRFLEGLTPFLVSEQTEVFLGVCPIKSPVVKRVRLRTLRFVNKESGEVKTFYGVFVPPRLSHSPLRLGFISEKMDYVSESLGLSPSSYAYRSAADFVQLLPPDELLSISKQDLKDLVAIALSVEEIPRLYLTLVSRSNALEQAEVRVDIVLPASRYSEHLSADLMSRLASDFGEGSLELSTISQERRRCFISFTVFTESHLIDEVDISQLEAELDIISMSWTERFRVALNNLVGETRCASLFQSYYRSFESSYQDDYSPEQGARDIVRFDEVRRSPSKLDLEFVFGGENGGELRLRVFKLGPWMALSELLPVIEHFGFIVINELPYRFNLHSDSGWLLDLGLELRDKDSLAVMVSGDDLFRAKAAMLEVWTNEGEDDELNSLVISGSLTYRDVSLLRAYAHYLRFSTLGFSSAYIKFALRGFPVIAGLLVKRFYERFSAHTSRDSSIELGNLDYEKLIYDQLATVSSLDFDKMFRAILSLIDATVRTNFFMPSKPKGVALKFDPSSLSQILPQPLPKHEFYYLSKTTEAVHLRGGDVARGGIRWSDRLEDFRIEILGLMKAQSVKNSVIVPVGAKGGFVVRGGDRDQSRVVESYKEFISALFDLTDNISSNEVIHPKDVVVLDGDDPYLVVAADKGTATFSDIANEIAIERGFWLGDAFASGGSEGYDHKKMAITAKGAWMSVRHHFGQMGIDPERDPVTVVGIGDMSGDVFGNGMLLSRSMRLVAAFDHRDIFLDPNPDVDVAYLERRRLFDLPRSSWADYDQTKISSGGGVFSRSLKTVPLSKEMAEVLGIEPGSYEPSYVIRSILKSPVDLLWNGGIGTYVKATTENNDEVSDRSNDGVRVDAKDLRVKVVGEGGNLGFTQRGRIEYALLGGRCNTDAIDNSAGVDTSDHEVNLKILFASAIEEGRLTKADRTPLLFSATKEVESQVLEDNVYQNWVLSASEQLARSKMTAIGRLTARLISEAELDPDVEFLPSPKRVLAIAAKGGTITRPELSVLLAYAKLDLYHHVLDSELVSDDFSNSMFVEYFPESIWSELMPGTLKHPLRKEIVATVLANKIVNLTGLTAVFELAEISSVSVAQAAKALLASLEILDVHNWVESLMSQENVAQGLRVTLFNRLALSTFRMARWLITSGQLGQSLSEVVGRFEPAFPDVYDNLSFVLDRAGYDRVEKRTAELIENGVEKDSATFFGAIDTVVSVPAIVLLEELFNLGSPTKAARIFFAVGTLANLPTLRSHLSTVSVSNHWEESSRELLFVDLSDIQMELAKSATKYLLSHVDEGDATMDPIALWGLRHRTYLDKVRTVLRSLGEGDEPVTLAQLYVSIREIALLVRSIEIADAADSQM